MLLYGLKFVSKKIKNIAICPFTVALYLLKYQELIIKKEQPQFKTLWRKKVQEFYGIGFKMMSCKCF